jgi:PilZ domain
MRMDPLDLPSTTEPSSGDRREHPRIEMLGRLRGVLEPLQVPTVIRDISVGGFALETPFSFEPGTRHEFRFVMTEQTSSGSFGARVVRSLRVSSLNGQPRFVTGFEFAEQDSPEDQTALNEMIYKLISSRPT